MIKYKKLIKEQIVKLFNENPEMSKSDMQSAIINFISGLEPLDDGDIEKYEAQTSEMINNYLKAKRGV